MQYLAYGLLIAGVAALLYFAFGTTIGRCIGYGLDSDFERRVDEEPWPSGPITPEDKHPKRVA